MVYKNNKQNPYNIKKRHIEPERSNSDGAENDSNSFASESRKVKKGRSVVLNFVLLFVFVLDLSLLTLQVEDGSTLTGFVLRCLDDPAWAATLGGHAPRFVASQRGAVAATARMILERLPVPGQLGPETA